jgi:hypothetical protein
MQVTIDVNKKSIYDIIKQLDIEDKIDILNKLEDETFAVRLKKIRKSIPKSNITEKEILEEIKKERNK